MFASRPLSERNRIAGTEYGMYLSIDAGKNWEKMATQLTSGPITDLAIKDFDLIVATQGRSFWVLDDLSLLHQWNETITNKTFISFNDERHGVFRAQKMKRKKAEKILLLNLSVNFYLQQKPDSNTIARRT